MAKRKYFWMLVIIPLLCHVLGTLAEACPACWAGYGKGDERYNKPLADLRIIYEKDGREALPYIKKALTTSTDPLVLRRAAGYIVELNDTDSIPLFEDMIMILVKRVAFSSFGLDTYDFKGRLAVAHALAKFGQTDLGDKIWQRYGRLDLKRKSEVPYILNGLQDPHLDERLMDILNREEDHQLMVGALDVLAIGGSEKALPSLRSKAEEWSDKTTGTGTNPDPEAPVIYYAPLRIKAEQAISAIEDRRG